MHVSAYECLYLLMYLSVVFVFCNVQLNFGEISQSFVPFFDTSVL